MFYYFLFFHIFKLVELYIYFQKLQKKIIFQKIVCIFLVRYILFWLKILFKEFLVSKV